MNNIKSNNIKVRTYQFSISIIKFISELPNKKIFFSIGDQLLRSATSIGANIIEAQASISRKEFIKYFQISLKSSNESEYWLKLLTDSFPEYHSQIFNLLNENIEISKMLGASLLTLKGKKNNPI